MAAVSTSQQLLGPKILTPYLARVIGCTSCRGRDGIAGTVWVCLVHSDLSNSTPCTAGTVWVCLGHNDLSNSTPCTYRWFGLDVPRS